METSASDWGQIHIQGGLVFPFFLLTIHQNLAPILTKALVT